MNIDVNKIINGTPYKRILNGYNTMKDNYTQESAKDFHEIYSKENLSDILENSRMIFSEPYIGLDFYKNIVLESSSCIFTELKNEYAKVEEFVTENADKMSDTQKDLYVSSMNEFKNYVESVDDIILVSSYLKSGENEVFEKELSDILYNEKKAESVNVDNVINYINEHADLRLIMTYTPFIYEMVEAGGKLNQVISEKTSVITESENWSSFVLNTVIMNKLNESLVYTEAVNAKIHNPAIKAIFKGLMVSDIGECLESLKATPVKDENVVLHESSQLAIENLYVEKFENELFSEEIKAERDYIDKCTKEAVDAEFGLLSYEYSHTDNTDKACSGYTFVEEGSTLENAYMNLSSKYADNTSEDDSFFEKSEDDKKDDDEDIDSELDDLYKDEDESPKMRQTASSKKDEKDLETYTSGDNTSTSSHIKAPKTGNVANRIQTKAQDNNVKMLGAAGKIKKVAQDTGNAVKAVAKLPIAFVKGLKAEIHKLDEMDDERRKAYLTAPGYRRSVIKKLHLALLYGGAAQINLALIPVVMTYRHFSKIKDKRMKAEAIRDLEAEIKVCDAKIEDAQQSDDKAQRYQLIRIKEKLNAELIRVTTNSKYI